MKPAVIGGLFAVVVCSIAAYSLLVEPDRAGSGTPGGADRTLIPVARGRLTSADATLELERHARAVQDLLNQAATSGMDPGTHGASAPPTLPPPPPPPLPPPPATNYAIFDKGGDGVEGVSIRRSGTVPSFLIAVKTSGSNADFANYGGGAQFAGGVYHNGHEPITALFQHLLTGECAAATPACAADVGANAGFYTQLFLAMGCRVRTFEIQRELYKLVQLGAWLNNAGDRLIIKNVGASNVSGTAKVDDSGFKSGGNAVALASDTAVPGGVPVEPLDNVLQDAACQTYKAVKIDVEGSELKAFGGLKRMLKAHAMQNILFEFGGKHWKDHGLGATDGFNALNDLVAAGYGVRLIDMKNQGGMAREWSGKPITIDTQKYGGFSPVTVYDIPPSAFDSLTKKVVDFDINLWAYLP